MIVGLSPRRCRLAAHGLTAHGVPPTAADAVATCRRSATLFAAFLGYNPIQKLLGPAACPPPASQQHVLVSKGFFPQVISAPFSHALGAAFAFGLASMLIAALASAIPARGQPWIGDGRRRKDTAEVIPEGPTGTIEPLPATGELRVARGPRAPHG